MVETAVTFGPFSLDASAGLLARDGKPLPLGGRAMALLVALAKADEAVSKQALMEAGWPGTVVEEGNLTVQIAALRKALGDRPDGGDWIVTVPRVGYRLVRGETAAPAEAQGLPVLAVLPFETIGAEAGLAPFAAGLVEELVSALSRFRSFTVLARTATGRAEAGGGDIGEGARRLGASYLVEGSVRGSGRQVRIAARLAVVASGSNLWTHSFDGMLDDAFDFQEQVAAVTAGHVNRAIRQAELNRVAEGPAAGGSAYDLMQRGITLLELLQEDANRRAITLLEQAVALEPQDPVTLSMASWGYEQRIHAGWVSTPAEEARCLALARSAVALGGDDASILGHCGMALQLCGGEWEHGLQTTLRGVEINPNNQAALFFSGVAHLVGGTLEGAREMFERARRLAAHDEAGNTLSGLAHVYLCEGQFEDALGMAERAVAMRPRFFWPHWALIAANAHLGRLDAARDALAIYRAADPAATLGRIAHGQRSRDPDRHANLLEGLRLAGMPDG